MLIVDPETREENPVGKVGEIWVHGDNVAEGYWRNPQAPRTDLTGLQWMTGPVYSRTTRTNRFGTRRS